MKIKYLKTMHAIVLSIAFLFFNSDAYAARDCNFENLTGVSSGETRQQKGIVRIKKFCTRTWTTGLTAYDNLRIIKAPKEADIILRSYEIGFKFYKLGPTQIIYEIDTTDRYGKKGKIRVIMNIEVVE